MTACQSEGHQNGGCLHHQFFMRSGCVGDKLFSLIDRHSLNNSVAFKMSSPFCRAKLPNLAVNAPRITRTHCFHNTDAVGVAFVLDSISIRLRGNVTKQTH